MPINPDDYIEWEGPPEETTESPEVPGKEIQPEPQPPEQAPQFSPPHARSSLAGEGMIRLLDGLVEFTTGVPPQIPASLRELAAEVLSQLNFPSGLPTHRISPSSRWKWGLAIIGAYATLAFLGAFRLRRALNQLQRQQQTTQEQAPQKAEPEATPRETVSQPFAEVPLPNEETAGMINEETQTLEVDHDSNRDDSGSGSSA